jgi:hypothetical protein
MIVHRLLDAVFRTLDTVDALRARVDAALGRAEAQPPSSWPPLVEVETSDAAAAVRAVYEAPPDLDAWRSVPATEVTTVVKPAKASSTSQKAPATTLPDGTGSSPKATPARKKARASTAAARPKKAPGKKEQTQPPAAASRKGSVDRSGKDFDSPRARAVEAWLKEHGSAVIAEDAALDGKRTLARVLWAVAVAESAGSEQGLTAADTSALLSSAAGVEVFATNVARTFRDQADLFVETSPDGRSKRYTVTAAGRARLAELATR